MRYCNICNNNYTNYCCQSTVVSSTMININQSIKFGNTNSRPSENFIYIGFEYFDTTLNKPIWWNGNIWIDATGTAV